MPKLYMKQKVFSWTDQFTVKDEQENDRYLIHGEFLSLGKKLHIFDMQQQEVAFIRQKILALFARYIVEIDGQEVCQVVQEFSLLRPKYRVEGLNWEIQGNFWEHEYTINQGRDEIMRISKHWFTWGDSYELDIAQPENELLCLCVALAIDAAVEQSNNSASSSSSASSS